MSLKKLFTPLFLLSVFFSFGQITPEIKDIIIDFSTKKVGEIPNDIKPGDYYRIVIKNMNQNLWKVSLNTSDSVTIKKLETPTFGSVKIEELSSLVANLSSITSSSKANVESVNKGINDIFISIDDSDEDEAIINKEISSQKKKLLEFSSDQNGIVEGIDGLKYKTAKLQLYYFDENEVIKNGDFNLEESIKEIEEYRSQIIVLKDVIKIEKAKYLEVFYKKHVDAINKKQEFKDAHKLIVDSYNKFETTLNKIFESINSENAIKLLKSIVFLKAKSLNYTSLPIQFNGDKAIVKLKIEPKKEDFNLQVYEMPLLFPVEDDDYWSIGVSFYGANLYDERFSSVSEPVTDSTQVYSLIQEDKQKSELGIATLLRFGTKFKVYKDDKEKKLGIHGTIGPGISIEEKIKPRLLLGAGLSHGSKHNIALDFGFIFGYVERKSNAFSLDETYIEKPQNVTISKLSTGVFLSLGYLFTF